MVRCATRSPSLVLLAFALATVALAIGCNQLRPRERSAGAKPIGDRGNGDTVQLRTDAVASLPDTSEASTSEAHPATLLSAATATPVTCLAAGEGRVFVGREDGSLTRWDADSTGFSLALSVMPTCLRLVRIDGKDRLLVGGRGRLLCLDAETGESLWETRAFRGTVVGVGAFDRSIWVADAGPFLVELRAADGARRGPFGPAFRPGDVRDLDASRCGVVFALHSGRIGLLDHSGCLRWEAEPEGGRPIRWTRLLEDGVVSFGAVPVRYDREGKEIWRGTQVDAATPLAVEGNRCAWGSGEGRVAVLGEENPYDWDEAREIRSLAWDGPVLWIGAADGALGRIVTGGER